MSSLRAANLFLLKTLISNFNCKASTITDYDANKQMLCLVSEDNEVILRYTNNSGANVLKLISWFKESSRVIHDVSFDPSGCWLLVLCFDNTLHIVPALRIVDENQPIQGTFSITEITSFVIPFVGPHECPNSKTCPNNDISTTPSSSPLRLADYTFDQPSVKEPEMTCAKPLVCTNLTESLETPPPIASEINRQPSSSQTSSSRKSSRIDSGTSGCQTNTGSIECVESFLTSSTCPYPICVTWWQTLDGRNRAIIGYSDGSICFVGLSPNCPFIANTSIENGAVLKLLICRDNCMENVTLLINSQEKQQWKLLLEQKHIKYIFPGDFSSTGSFINESHDNWQFVMSVKASGSDVSESHINTDVYNSEDSNTSGEGAVDNNLSSEEQDSLVNEELNSSKVGLLPAARAKLASLKSLGTQKLNAFKMKLSTSRYTGDYPDDYLNTFAIVDSPSMSPEILTTPAGPNFIVQNLRNTYLLSALHGYSDTLSVHSMDISLIPLFLYKIPKQCQNILISSNLLYSIQLISKDNQNSGTESNDETERINAVGVISSAIASIKNGEQVDFNTKSLLGLFEFKNEVIINVYRMATYDLPQKANMPKEESNDTLQTGELRSAGSYIRLQKKRDKNEPYNLRDIEIMQNEFPKLNYDPCIIITNKGVYYIEMRDEPHIIFLKSAIDGAWNFCEEFCLTFDLSFQQCIEFSGDCLLKNKKVTQALLTYNVARIPPVRTALKLAMYGENYALMHLCAMALKSVFILKSRYFCKPIINYIIADISERHTEDISYVIPKKPEANIKEISGKFCSNFSYDIDETPSSLQMSASSQFHLSNLLLITLAEKAVREKSYVPLWNFLVTNSKFHTNMTSIVLCQSGLYSAALLLSLVRGACIDVFVGLVSVANQEFGWYSEINVLLFNLSDTLFCECLTYLRHISSDYFNIIQNKLDKINVNVLKRLAIQLDPFSPVLRPIVFCMSPKASYYTEDDNNAELNNFYKLFVETYLTVLLELQSRNDKSENLLNALSVFRLSHEDNQFAIDSSNFAPLSVGCSHSACIIDGCAYFWGSNGIPCIYSVTKSSEPPDPPHVVKSLDILAQLNLFVHSVKCGRQHSLILTNNGLYAFGSNQLGQLGLKRKTSMALQPMLVEKFDGLNITILEAGQYHNAAVAEGRLYTWGWGIYGQLGHGDPENVSEPKIVSFFKPNLILQVSLGHAHSLVLCNGENGARDLFVFGSNHFGQLGVGQSSPFGNSNLVKSLVPIKLEFDDGPIRLIHTNFFSNLIVTDKNKLYTWGSSPQALRLANQIKRRASAKQKIEDNLRRQINKRLDFESNDDKNGEPSYKEIIVPVPKEEDAKEEDQSSDNDNDTGELADTTSVESVESVDKTEEKSSYITSDEVEIKCENLSTIEQKPIIADDDSGASITKVEVEDKKIVDTEPVEHLHPHIIDTSEVSGEINQISSGLFHYALISSTSLLYTWGKNLEHQLGTEDKDRKSVNKPTPLESIIDPMYVECGADFTVVMMKDYSIKAFGGNTNGQCGKDLGPPAEKGKQGKLFCLPMTKRLMRLEGQCVENPIEVNIPRPRIRMDTHPTKYLKCVPEFKMQFLERSELSFDIDTVRSLSSETREFCNESDDLASSAEISVNDEDSLASAIIRLRDLSSDVSPEEDNKVDVIDPANKGNYCNFLHYCLYIFHGLYDSERLLKVTNRADNMIVFRVRILMLNFKFVEAFKLCLTQCQNAQISIKFFEYFTKDTSIVPMRRQDLKFFIYQIFIHFLDKKFDLVECEKFFLTDLDYYLLELSYVLFFNNNNTDIEQNLNSKFKNMFIDDNDNQNLELIDTDKIFNSLSVKFKAIICQRLLQVCENDK